MTAQILSLLQFLPLILVSFVFYFLVIRPGRLREARRLEAIQSLKVGDKVEMELGFLGCVQAIYDDYMEIELAPGLIVHMVESGIIKVIR